MDNDINADEAAAQAIQEAIWLEEELADPEVAHQLLHNQNGGVPEFVRQLLRERRAGVAAAAAAQQNQHEPNPPPGEDEDDDEAVLLDGEAIDAGVAGEVLDENSNRILRPVKCPLLLYLEIDDDALESLCPGNKYLKRGSTVYIGLDKTTKLEVVFQQFCNFVNRDCSSTTGLIHSVKLSDFEFVHCTLLDKSHTVEASAMMKNDRIKVRKNDSKRRTQQAEIVRLQRESDRKYFTDLRQLIQSSDCVKGSDVMLDCRGQVVDERGFKQKVLATTVRVNSAVLSKRCPWLADKIEQAREEAKRREEMMVPIEMVKSEEADEEEDEDNNDGTSWSYETGIVKAIQQLGGEDVSSSSTDIKNFMQQNMPSDITWSNPTFLNALRDAVDSGDLIKVHSTYRLSDSFKKRNKDDSFFEGNSDDEDDILPAFPAREDVGGNHSIKVEDDDDEEEEEEPPMKKVKVSSFKGGNPVVVPLDHSPEAVKLMLEYSYTNRVLSLGSNAFHKASRHIGPNGVKDPGPVPPYRKHDWPKNGAPTVSLPLALAGIALAEEAQMPRFSLMCEIAASQLVNQNNVLDVLSACQSQQQKTGNKLSILRKSAMVQCIYSNGSTGIDRLMERPGFKNNFEEKSALVIPSLLEGTVELLPSNLLAVKDWQKKKEKMEADTNLTFLREDNSDKFRREAQRKKYREMETIHRRVEAAFGPEDLAASSPRVHSYREEPPPIKFHRVHKRKSRSDTHRSDAHKGSSRRSKRERP